MEHYGFKEGDKAIDLPSKRLCFITDTSGCYAGIRYEDGEKEWRVISQFDLILRKQIGSQYEFDFMR